MKHISLPVKNILLSACINNVDKETQFLRLKILFKEKIISEIEYKEYCSVIKQQDGIDLVVEAGKLSISILTNCDK